MRELLAGQNVTIKGDSSILKRPEVIISPEDTTRQTLFDIKKVGVKYRDRYNRHKVTTAVADVNAHIYYGEFNAIIGPSGGGKSTLIRQLNLLNRRNPFLAEESGEIHYSLPFKTEHGSLLFATQEILDLHTPKSDKTRIDEVAVAGTMGYVMQQGIPLRGTIFDNVAEGLCVRGYHKRPSRRWLTKQEHKEEYNFVDEVVEKSLKMACVWDDVSGRLRESAELLSGGQVQRVSMAAAFATLFVGAKTLLFDEAFAPLDPVVTNRIEDNLRILQQYDGITVIMISHRMEQVKRLAKHVVVTYPIYDQHKTPLYGTVIEEGPAEKIFTGGASRQETRDLISGKSG